MALRSLKATRERQALSILRRMKAGQPFSQPCGHLAPVADFMVKQGLIEPIGRGRTHEKPSLPIQGYAIATRGRAMLAHAK